MRQRTPVTRLPSMTTSADQLCKRSCTPASRDKVERYPLPAVRVESDRVADRLGCPWEVKVGGSPACPAPDRGGIVSPLLGPRVDGESQGVQAVDVLGAESPDSDLPAVDHVVEHEDHAPRRHSPEASIALGENDRGPISRRAHCRRHPGGTSPDHHHITLGHNFGRSWDGCYSPRLGHRGLDHQVGGVMI